MTVEESRPMHVVIGASGGIGGALVRELARRGHRVRAVNRAGDAAVPAGIERLAAGVATPDGAKPAADWPAAFPPLTEAIAEGATAAGAKLVLADNLYLYGPHDGPLTEDLPPAAAGPEGRAPARPAPPGPAARGHRPGVQLLRPWRPGQRHRRAPVPRRRGRPDGALGGPPRPAPHPQLPGGRGRRP